MSTIPTNPRRNFIGSGIAAALAAPWLGTRAAEQSVGPDRVSEPAREVPLNDDTDVIVCGAGPAGVTAAITAARRFNGSRKATSCRSAWA